MQKHIKIAKYLIRSNQQLSIGDNMVHLAATLEIQSHILDELKKNWENTMDMILNSHKPFLKKYGVISRPQIHIRMTMRKTRET